VIHACLLDGFGTAVGRHTSLPHDLGGWAAEKGIDGVELAREWRSLYDPATAHVRGRRREEIALDALHLEGLVGGLDRYGLTGLDDDEIDRLDGAWDQLERSLHAVSRCQGSGVAVGYPRPPDDGDCLHDR
jgi:2-haloacid dehalogenase